MAIQLSEGTKIQKLIILTFTTTGKRHSTCRRTITLYFWAKFDLTQPSQATACHTEKRKRFFTDVKVMEVTTTTIWKFVILVGKKAFYRSEKIFFDTIFLSEIQKKSEVLIIKKIIIIARLVFEISQFFKNFSFFLAIAPDGTRSRAIGSAVILPEISSKKAKNN